MKDRSCKTCRFHKAEVTDITTDDEGNESPIFQRYCTVDGRNTKLKVIEFACGLWRERA